MRANLALFAVAVLGVVLSSLPARAAAGVTKCLHVDGVTTWSVPHLTVNNERNETVTVSLLPVEYSPTWAVKKTWTVAAKKEQKFDLWGTGVRYDRINVAGNGWSGILPLYPAYETYDCGGKYWAIRVKVYGEPKSVDGRVVYLEGGYRFK